MSEEKKESYRVLARKYRPQNFDALIGQDALVRTLKNAIESGRIAHAFMLTGIRGTGKTATARIIAKALNYKGPDGNAGPTTGSTDDCEICQAISADRHPDIMEMDAASRTGVDDIREILDGVRYAPTSARYKVYIIDEVHMLSKAAFNALLKTLEEPPEHVIFIFATTEIRKVPVTVLSRCQRFDLRRVDIETLATYYKEICGKEEIGFEEDAITLIARAADGSVRDGLSLLDQAIALSKDKITIELVQEMLGLADRNLILDCLENGIKGECGAALSILDDLYRKGSDPVIAMQDMLDFAHLLTRLKAAPDNTNMNAAISSDLLGRLQTLSSELSMPTLGRSWQILLKGLDEVRNAPNPQAAAEMVLIRLSYAANLPDPATLIKKIENGEGFSPAGGTAPSTGTGASPTGGGAAATNTTAAPQPQHAPATETTQAATQDSPVTASYGAQSTALASAPENVIAPDTKKATETATETAFIEDPQTLEDIEALLRQTQNLVLAGSVFQHVHLVSMKKGKLDIRLHPHANPELPGELSKKLREILDEPWMVTISKEGGQPTLAEKRDAAEQAALNAAKEHPLVKNTLIAFPGAEVQLKDKPVNTDNEQ